MEVFLAALRGYTPAKVDAGVCYMRFGIGRLGWFWFAVGLDSPDLRAWQYGQMLPAFARAIVWC